MIRRVMVVTAMLAAALLIAPVAARAEITNCTEIVAVPATLTVPGIYCFKRDLATSQTTGTAITVLNNSITIDMNGFKLGGLTAGPETVATGIKVFNWKNFTLRNGTIRGFAFGLTITDNGSSSGHLVEDVAFDENTYAAAWVVGSNFIFRNNRITKTIAKHPVFNVPTGVIMMGSSAIVTDNQISHVEGVSLSANNGPVGAALGLTNSVFERNTITDVRVTDEGPTVRAIGISVASGSSNLVLRDNNVLDVNHAQARAIEVNGSETLLDGNVVKNSSVPGATGIDVGSSSAMCMRNFVHGFADAMEPCSFEQNNVTP
jgi:hypothetical protein